MRPFNGQNRPIPVLQAGVDFSDPLDVEIGAGQGLHAIRYAESHPDRNLIAIERTQTKFSAMARRNAHHHLTNLQVIRADAVNFLYHFVPDATIQNLFLLYPNPYVKKSKSRWHFSSAMLLLHQKMAREGILHISTNLLWYAQECSHELCRLGLFRLVADRKLSPSDRPRTHFEAKYLARGETCFDLQFQKLIQ